jgi:hypothetical protein
MGMIEIIPLIFFAGFMLGLLLEPIIYSIFILLLDKLIEALHKLFDK